MNDNVVNANINITGTLIWYYYICKREVWLMSRSLEAEQNNVGF
ncbi:Dna2/Cas4 domain-containing protein [Candidatus Poribacteria bacterium]|nr:Dna2/Cas4 domain-containing protein [Candidatus Poribacteria bacterium]